MWIERSQVLAVTSTHCTMYGKDLPLVTSSRPRTVREPTTLGSSFLIRGPVLVSLINGRWSYLTHLTVNTVMCALHWWYGVTCEADETVGGPCYIYRLQGGKGASHGDDGWRRERTSRAEQMHGVTRAEWQRGPRNERDRGGWTTLVTTIDGHIARGPWASPKRGILARHEHEPSTMLLVSGRQEHYVGLVLDCNLSS
jgi:hypothetical protein